MPERLSLAIADAEAMAATGAAIGRVLAGAARERPWLVLLEGPLGAGKTTLARGLLRGLGHEGRVPSPTYTLIEPYLVDGLRVHHLDLYRLADEGELTFLGVSDWIEEPGLTLVEWPERAPRLLPLADLRIDCGLEERGRRLTLVGPARLLARLAAEVEGMSGLSAV
jgi:tRNA threonylcarbamoyladenosine biosynthesis protein TsaE